MRSGRSTATGEHLPGERWATLAAELDAKQMTAREVAQALRARSSNEFFEALTLELRALGAESEVDDEPIVGEAFIVTPPDPTTPDEHLWGPEPDAAALSASIAAAQAAVTTTSETVLGSAFSRDDAARHLGIKPQAVSWRIAHRKLAAIKRGRQWRLPAWQFDEDGVVTGLEDVLGAWRGSLLSLSTWVTRPNADLDHRAPVDVLAHEGGVHRVLMALAADTAPEW